MSSCVRVLALSVLAALPCAPAVAQQPPTSTVRGTIQDQTGAIVPGVRVTIVDATGAVRGETTTDAAGGFVFQGVSSGTYDIRTAFEGFQPASVHIRVGAGRTVSLQKIVLQLAAINQAVTVGETAPVTIAAAGNRDAIVFDDRALKDLPIFDRDVVGTLSRFLDPGAAASGGVTLVVDGMEARKVGVAPSAIQQIKINQDPYSAEFQRPGRGRIEVVTKAGSDAYHGSFDFAFRDARLNARDAFAPTRPPGQRRLYEGVFGGPIRDGKNTSFLLTVERREEDLQSIVFAATPAGTVNAIVARPARDLEYRRRGRIRPASSRRSRSAPTPTRRRFGTRTPAERFCPRPRPTIAPTNRN